MLMQAVELMGLGLIGVFSALTMFFISIKILVKLFPAKKAGK